MKIRKKTGRDREDILQKSKIFKVEHDTRKSNNLSTKIKRSLGLEI